MGVHWRGARTWSPIDRETVLDTPDENGSKVIYGAYVSAEEVVANYTACEALSGTMSTEMKEFNLGFTASLRLLDGVDERLDDLRTYSLVGSERLKLTASAGCGG